MKSKTLTVAALAALAFSGTAQAVHLDPGGRGQVLIYPYYTVNKQQQTLLSVTNTAAVAQAVKVRFNEGYNGRMVRDLNIYLSPFDSWTGTVFALRNAGVDSDGSAVISTDTSCTAVDAMPLDGSLNGTPYFHFSDFLFTVPADGGPYTIDRTREGYIEVYAMADIAAPLSAAIAHGSNGSAPAGCADVHNLENNDAALSTPTGGLMGSISIIDVAQGTYLSVRAEGLAGFTGSKIFSLPPNVLPNLEYVNDGVGPLANRATARLFDGKGQVQTLTYPGASPDSRKVDAVSAVLMADRVYNEYQIGANLGAASDWLLTMPTKPFYTDFRFIVGGAIAPFVKGYDGSRPPLDRDRYSPVNFGNRVYSRDGVSGNDCGPLFGGQSCGAAFRFSYVTNIFPVRRTFPFVAETPSSPVLGSRLVPVRHSSLHFPAPWELPISDSGHMAVDLNPPHEAHQLLPSAEGKVLRGLPVIGFWASNIVNNNVSNGVLANYAAAVRHAASVTCVKASDGRPCD